MVEIMGDGDLLGVLVRTEYDTEIFTGVITVVYHTRSCI